MPTIDAKRDARPSAVPLLLDAEMDRLTHERPAVGGEPSLLEGGARDTQRDGAARVREALPRWDGGSVERVPGENAQERRVIASREDQEECVAVHGRAVGMGRALEHEQVVEPRAPR